jgi:cyclic 2,3-diphosphoglycerate synthetase
MAEAETDHEAVADAVREVKDVPVVSTVLRPRPVEPVEGKRVAFFTTARADAAELLARHLAEEHGAAEVVVSTNLSNRDELRRDLERTDADVYLVEIKAAAIDVVCEAASEDDIEVVFADNDVLPVAGQPDLDEELRTVAEAATVRSRKAAV